VQLGNSRDFQVENYLKVLLVAPDYPPYNQGGGGVVYMTIAQKMAQRGHNVSVIAGYNGNELKKEFVEENGHRIEVFWVPLMSIFTNKHPKFKSYLPPKLTAFRYLNALNYNDYDVIHLLAFGHILTDFINLVARSHRKILTIHGFPKYVESQGNASFFTKLLYKLYTNTLARFTLNSTDTITVVTKFVAEECLKNGIKPHKVKIISNGIDLDRYINVKYDLLQEKYKIMKEDVLLLSIARIDWFKGFENAIEPIDQLMKKTNRPFKYMIIGAIEDRYYYSKLKKQIESKGIKNNVIFTGFIDHSLKLQALTRADIFLVPSLHESFGIVSLEAMAMGKPIVASNLEGISCILDHMSTGFLVQAGRPIEIADAITNLLDNPELRNKLSSNAKIEVKKYDWNKIMDNYEMIYRQLR